MMVVVVVVVTIIINSIIFSPLPLVDLGSESEDFFFLKTGSRYVSLASLEPSVKTRLTSNTETEWPLPPECWNQQCPHHS